MEPLLAGLVGVGLGAAGVLAYSRLQAQAQQQKLTAAEHELGSLRPVVDEKSRIAKDCETALHKEEAASAELKRAELQAEHDKRTAEEERTMLSGQLETRLRDPMNRILGLAEQLWETELTALQREDVAMLRHHGGELVSVVNDCLDFSSLAQHKLPLDRISFRLLATLTNTVNQVRIAWQLDDESLRVEAAAGLPEEVSGDPGRVRQVLGHALQVALTERSGRLDVAVKLLNQEPGLVTIGIEVVERTPGGRRPGLEPSTPQSALTRRINERLVELMGGNSLLVGAADSRTVVQFQLRLQLPTIKIRLTPSNDVAHLRGISVLIIGDDDQQRRQLERILRSWHMHPHSVGSLEAAGEAFRKAGSTPFKAVLVDASLPAHVALDAPRLVADRTAHRPRFLRLTWVGWRGEAAACREAGYAGYLTRPITQSDLFDALVTAVAQADTGSAQQAVLVTRHLLRETRHQLNVMVAEDNRLYQAVLRYLLEDRGYTVHTVGDGRQAVEWYREHTLDLILMDVQMPEMDGLEATAEIRRIEQKGSRRVPIVAATANTTVADRERCLRAGMDSYVSKPIYPQLLFAAIDEALGVGQGLASARSDNGDKGPHLRLKEDIDEFFATVTALADRIKHALEERDGATAFTYTCKVQEHLETLPAPAATQTATQLALLSQDGRWSEASDVFRSLLAEVEQLRPTLARLAREERVRIVLAEDDDISRMVLEDMLMGWGYDVTSVTDGTEAWEVLQQDDPPRLAILDWMMPGMDGLQVCREVRRRAQEPYIYLLLLTARNEKEDIIEGLDAGADDYLVKPVDGHELKVRLRAGRRVLDLQEELISAREVLRLQATRDPLTGLLNRGAILDLLTSELARGRRQHMPLSLLLIDLDHFKNINDTFGHQTGDAVLREASRRMRMTLRPYDGVGRYGGEEFIIVLPGADPAGVEKMAERVRRSLDDEPILVGDKPLHVTASFGISTSAAMSEPDMASLIRAADTALYRAKNTGRNRVEVAKAPEYAMALEAH